MCTSIDCERESRYKDGEGYCMRCYMRAYRSDAKYYERIRPNEGAFSGAGRIKLTNSSWNLTN